MRCAWRGNELIRFSFLDAYILLAFSVSAHDEFRYENPHVRNEMQWAPFFQLKIYIYFRAAAHTLLVCKISSESACGRWMATIWLILFWLYYKLQFSWMRIMRINKIVCPPTSASFRNMHFQFVSFLFFFFFFSSKNMQTRLHTASWRMWNSVSDSDTNQQYVFSILYPEPARKGWLFSFITFWKPAEEKTRPRRPFARIFRRIPIMLRPMLTKLNWITIGMQTFNFSFWGSCHFGLASLWFTNSFSIHRMCARFICLPLWMCIHSAHIGIRNGDAKNHHHISCGVAAGIQHPYICAFASIWQHLYLLLILSLNGCASFLSIPPSTLCFFFPSLARHEEKCANCMQ